MSFTSLRALARRYRAKVFIAAVAALGLFASTEPGLRAQNQPTLQPLPPLLRQVSDAVGVMSIAEGRVLSNLLAEIEEKTRTKIIVVIMPTVAPESVEDYAQRLADRWLNSGRILENGRFVFIAIAKEDRAVRVLPSRSLSRVLAPLQSSETMRQVPGLLRQDRYYEALTAIAKKLSEFTAERSV
jgi:uncharacterized protein